MNKYISAIIHRAACSILISVLAVTACYAKDWPNINSIEGEIAINDPDTAEFNKLISDTSGTPVYELICRTGELDDDIEFNYSGLLHCRLKSLDPDNRIVNLLAEEMHPDRDWLGRGRFFLEDIIESCGTYPDYGSKRVFLLRNMRITLQITNIIFGTDKDLNSYVFIYSFVPDRTSSKPIAEVSPYKEPSWFSTDDPCP